MGTILAIETSTPYCSVAVCAGPRLESITVDAGQRHSQLVLGMVSQVLKSLELALSDCSAIAFGAGPGSFTGLRIACAVAQGLAYGEGLPVLAIGTLAAMAEQCRGEVEGVPFGTRLLCVQDARMGEVYWSVFEWAAGTWAERVPPCLSKPEDIALADAPGAVLGCGNAFAPFAATLRPLVSAVLAPRYPEARAIALLGRQALDRGEGVAAALAAPLYVRDRVALTRAERAQSPLAAS